MLLVRISKLFTMLMFCVALPIANATSDSDSKHPHPENLSQKNISTKIPAQIPTQIPTKKCISCHEEQQLSIDISADVSVNESKKCNHCHQQEQKPQNRFIKTAAEPRDILQLNQEKLPADKKLLPNAGMQYPMYYRKSRLGDAPTKMVLVPAGEFIMGSDSRLPDEGPQHVVKLDNYYIDITEVTNLQYKKFNNATKRRSPVHFRNRSYPEGKADHPVTYVTWEDADAYCKWVGKRLPTDQEWEKAARGSDGRIFPWGNEFDATKANTPLRWQLIGSFGDTTPVGAFKEGASPHGLFDMSGNVWEWTASWYKPYPNNKVASESYGERYKTLKGGSWFDCSFYNCGISAPVFNRSFFSKRTKNDSFGFRCAKDAP